MQSVSGEDVDRTPQQLFQLGLKSAGKERVGVGTGPDHEIHIAARPVVLACEGPKDTDVSLPCKTKLSRWIQGDQTIRATIIVTSSVRLAMPTNLRSSQRML